MILVTGRPLTTFTTVEGGDLYIFYIKAFDLRGFDINVLACYAKNIVLIGYLTKCSDIESWYPNFYLFEYCGSTVFSIPTGRRFIRQNFATQIRWTWAVRINSFVWLDRLVYPVPVVLLPRNGFQAPPHRHHLEVLDVGLLYWPPQSANILDRPLSKIMISITGRSIRWPGGGVLIHRKKAHRNKIIELLNFFLIHIELNHIESMSIRWSVVDMNHIDNWSSDPHRLCYKHLT